MKLLKRLMSRYGVPREVFRESHDTLVIVGKARWMRWAGTPSNTTMVDWDGGPCLCVGDVARDALGVRTTRTIGSIEPIIEEVVSVEGLVRVRLYLENRK